jgi:hypothetical protein
MAWTDLTFVECSVLTAAKMTQLQGNFAALAAGASGAPPLALDAVSSLALVHVSSGLVAPQVSSLGSLALGADPAGTPARNTLYPANLPKAWVNFDATAVTSSDDLTGVRDSFNISGIVDLGTGNHQVYFDQDFADASYGLWLYVRQPGVLPFPDSPEIAAGYARCRSYDDSGAPVDVSLFCVLAFGDQP